VLDVPAVLSARSDASAGRIVLLGGVPAATLAATGLLSGDVERLDGLFRSPVEPFCSTWF
jgi:hypothetical protein